MQIRLEWFGVLMSVNFGRSGLHPWTKPFPAKIPYGLHLAHRKGDDEASIYHL
jgi:hypothetical protein